MQYEIRARSFAEILDLGLRLCIDQFSLLFGIAVPLYVLLALAGLLNPAEVGGEPGVGIFAGFFTVIIGMVVIWPIIGAAVTFAIAERFLGRQTTAADSLRSVLPIILPLLGTGLLAGLLAMGGLILLIIPGIYLMLCYQLTSQVCIVEHTFGMDALRRSRDLMRGNLARAFGILFLASVITSLLGAGVSLLAAVPLVGVLLGPFPTIMSLLYTSAVGVVLYFDIRCRKEGFDIQHLAQQVGGQTQAMAPVVERSL